MSQTWSHSYRNDIAATTEVFFEVPIFFKLVKCTHNAKTKAKKRASAKKIHEAF